MGRRTGRLRPWGVGTEDAAWRDGAGFPVLLSHLIGDVVCHVMDTLDDPGRFTEQSAAYVLQSVADLGLDKIGLDIEASSEG